MNSSSAHEKGAIPFYPTHLLVECICAIIFLAILVALTYVWHIPLDEMANPADTTYVPRPEWYFLFYFQLLKYFEGGLIVVGVFVLPLLFFLALFLLPFYDVKPTTNILRRPVAACLGIASVVLVLGLTWVSINEDANNPRIFKKIYFPPITAEQVAEGERLFSSFCVLCHAMAGKGGFMAPDLTQIGGRANRTYIENVIINPKLVNEGTMMSIIPLSEKERNAVSAFLSQQK